MAQAGVALLLAGSARASPGGGGDGPKVGCHSDGHDDPGPAGMTNCSAWPANGPSRPTTPLPPSQRHPVMLVPSMLGSVLDRSLHNSREPYPICPNGGWTGGGDWYQMWPPAGLDPSCSGISCLPTDWFPLYADCWAHDMTMAYNAQNDQYSDPQGVTIRASATLTQLCDKDSNIVSAPAHIARHDSRLLQTASPPLLTTSPLLLLLLLFGPQLAEYYCICNLLQDLGYTPNTEFSSLPYDWRKGPSDWLKPGGYFSLLKAEIEQLRASSGKRVVTVSFSLGGPVFAVFLNKYVDAAWKDANIANWVSFSGTFGGVQESLLQQLTYNGAFTVPSMDNKTALDMMRSWGSQNWMAASLPPNDAVVTVKGSSRTYLGKEIGDVFHLIDQPALEIAYHHNLASTAGPAPGVEAYIIGGTGHQTPRSYEFGPSKLDPSKPDIAAGPTNVTCVDGDQVATHDSLIGLATRWQAQGSQAGKPVHTIVVEASHGNTVSNGQALATLYTALLAAK